MLAISLFYNYAVENGTMELLGKKLLYLMKGNAKLLPYICFIICTVIAMLGAGASTNVIVGPFLFAMCLEAGVHPVICACAIGLGTLTGGDNPFNGQGGRVAIGLLEELSMKQPFQIALYTWFNSIMKQILVITLIYIIFKGYRCKRVEVQKPKAFDVIQKRTIWLILASFCAMILPGFLSLFLKNTVLELISKFCQPQCVMLICAAIAPFLKLGNQKETLKHLPMNTFVLIAGMSFLIGVATNAGLIDAISGMFTNRVPSHLVGPLLLLLAAFLSFFSSGLSVVCPLMFPLVPSLAEGMGLNPVMLISCIYIGAMSSSLSPFSTGGSMLIGACPDMKTKEYLSNAMIGISVVIPLMGFVMALTGMFGLFHIG